MAKKRSPEVMLTIDAGSETPLYRQIYEQIRDAVASGRLMEGEHLPSIRKLSEALGVSHTTVEQAFSQLAVEGFVRNMPRSGYVVEHVDTDYLHLVQSPDRQHILAIAQERNEDTFHAENDRGGVARYDFSYANLQPDSFPVKTWSRLTNDVLYSATLPELARYESTEQPGILERELARLLARTRAVSCTPEQVVIQAGTGESLAMILQLFDRNRHAVGVENPGYATMQEVARRQGFSCVPLPVWRSLEEFFAALERHRPHIIFSTPSHQFPTGRLLPLDARIRLLQWAEANDAFIIEDDSCNEFRYATKPIPSLQSLDAYGRVIYLCNVSKVLSPALRISYTVLPPKLLGRYWDLFNYAHPSVSWIDREVLARFIAEGQWDSQVNRVAKVNHRNHDELLRCLRRAFGDRLTIQGADTGMHLYVTVQGSMTQDELITRAEAEGARVYGTSRMWLGQPAENRNVMVGFSSIAFEDIEPGVQALARAWR